ncbi:hypothetical protein DL93DRAFT_2089390, partial [Clavulina sp. PMI_390]
LVPQSGSLRIFATSRPLPDIERALWRSHNKTATHRLQLGEQPDHQTTLRSYVHLKLHGKDFEDSDWSPSFKEGVASTLFNKSQSMFLWVKLQVKRLEGSTQTEASEILLDLPVDVAATYTRILSEVDKQRQYTVRAVLECIIAANFDGHSLSPLQIQEILRFNLRPTQNRPKSLFVGLDHQKAGAQATLPERNVDISKYLPSALLHLKENGGIQFIHFTVQEYLLSPPQSEDDPRHHFGTSLKDATSTYLLVLLSALDTMNAGSVPALTRYADQSWYIHTPSALAQDASTNALEHFLNPNSQSFH